MPHGIMRASDEGVSINRRASVCRKRTNQMSATFKNPMGRYETESWDESVKKYVFSQSFETLRAARAYCDRMNRLGGQYRVVEQ